MTFEIRPIGTIRSPFAEAPGTPIQPAYACGAEGVVEVFEPFAEGLADLDGFERVWLLYWCHRCVAARLRVVPYRDTREHGVFSTRAPARPNPIGLSCVGLVRVEGNMLHVKDIDVLDGTPLLDIKPYVPVFDSYAASRAGWFDENRAGRTTADTRFHGTDPPNSPG